MSRDDFDLLLSVGGAPVDTSKGDFSFKLRNVDHWNFGLKMKDSPIEAFRMTPAEAKAQRALKPARFKLTGRAKEGAEPDKVILSDLLKAPEVMGATGGKVFSGFHQLTGSCVGSGAGNALMLLSAVEVVRLKDPEIALVPFWPLAYGRGRMYGGMNGRGEGSFSEAQVEAFQKDGNLQSGLEGLPAYSDSDGLTLTSSTEMTWSDGRRVDEKWLKQSRLQLVKSASVVHNAAEGKAAITNGYPILFCGSWGGLMKCPITGTPPVLLNRRSGSWAHNQTCMAYWAHPQLGDLFGIWNQWGLRTHGEDPGGLPAGAYWIKATDFDYQARQGSCLAISQYQGTPRQDWIDWGNLW